MMQQEGISKDTEGFILYLKDKIQHTDEQDFNDKLSKLSEDEVKQLYKKYKEMGKISMDKLGAKLNYIQTLRGECPEGYEVEKFMAGGCVKCQKKAKETAGVFKDACGGKAKKRIKKNMGGTVSNSWSVAKDQKGAPIKNKVNINKDDTVHTDKGIYNVSNKNLPYKKLNAKEYQKLSFKDKMKSDSKDEANGKTTSGAGSVSNKGIKKNYFGGQFQRRIIKQ